MVRTSDLSGSTRTRRSCATGARVAVSRCSATRRFPATFCRAAATCLGAAGARGEGPQPIAEEGHQLLEGLAGALQRDAPVLRLGVDLDEVGLGGGPLR